MTKRILLALALAASVVGAIACTNPSSSSNPTTSLPSAAASLDTGASASTDTGTGASESTGLESTAPSGS